MVLVTTVVGYYVGLTGAPDYARARAPADRHDAGGRRHAGAQPVLGARRRRPDGSHARAAAAGWSALAARGAVFGTAVTRRRPRLPRGARREPGAAGDRGDDRAVPLRLHAAQAPDAALHDRRRGARRAAAGDRLGGRRATASASAPGCCSGSCSCGSCRTRWRSRVSTATTTRAPASGCFRWSTPTAPHRAPDRDRLPRPARGQPAADADRAGGPRSTSSARSCSARRSWRVGARQALAPSPGARAARAVRVAALPAGPARAAGVRQGMSSTWRDEPAESCAAPSCRSSARSSSPSFLVGIRW